MNAEVEAVKELQMALEKIRLLEIELKATRNLMTEDQRRLLDRLFSSPARASH